MSTATAEITISDFLLARADGLAERAKRWRQRGDAPRLEVRTGHGFAEPGDVEVRVEEVVYKPHAPWGYRLPKHWSAWEAMTVDEMHERYYEPTEPDAAMLKDAQAIRNIVELSDDYVSEFENEEYRTNDAWTAGRVAGRARSWRDDVLRALAQRFDDHADWREEWSQQ